MGYKPVWISPTVIVASGASTSSEVMLPDSGWTNVCLRVGTMSTGMVVGIQNSIDSGSTYQYLFHAPIQSTTVGTPQFFISAAVGSGAGFVPIPAGGLKTIRMVLTGVVSGGCSFSVVCSD